MTDNSSKNKSTRSFSDDHLGSCLTRFSFPKKLWHCPENWFTQSSFQVQGALPCKTCSLRLAKRPNQPRFTQTRACHYGVLIILITNSIALLNCLFCRNSIKGNVFNAGGIGFCPPTPTHSGTPGFPTPSSSEAHIWVFGKPLKCNSSKLHLHCTRLWAGRRERYKCKTKGGQVTQSAQSAGSHKVLRSRSLEMLVMDFGLMARGDKISIRNKSSEKCHFPHYLVAARNMELFSLSSHFWMPLRSVFLCL